MSFGTNIGYLRKKKGMTQEEFAERMYVSRQTVSRWETESGYP
jgi:transcriptional regulator with XRE-family HTH domain